jgi:Zn-dependent protease with chaperone function
MARFFLRNLRLIVAAMLISFVGCGVAQAAILRPNGVDRRVDAISDTTMLSSPATALVDERRQEAANRLVNWTIPGEVASFLASAAALFYFWKSGWAAALRDRLRRSFRSETLVRFSFGFALALLAKFAALVPDFYLYRVNRVLGIFTQLTPGWLNEWLLTTLATAIAAGIAAAAVLWLVDRTPRWYIYTAVAIVLVAVAAAYLSPSLPGFAHYAPLDGAAKAPLEALVRRAGYAGVPILVEDRSLRTGVETAAVRGIGPSHQIVISDTLVAADSPAEVEFVVADQLGHLARGDVLRVYLWRAFLLAVGVAIAISIADRVRFRRNDDPLSRLSLVGALLACVYLLAVPIDAAILRHTQPPADAYALALTHNRAAAVRALVRTADQQLMEVCPDVVARVFFDVTPPLGARVATINGVPNACP